MKTDIAFIGGRGIYSNYGGVENAIREITIQLAEKDIKLDVYSVSNKVDEVIELPANINSISIPDWIYHFFGQHGFVLSSVLFALFWRRPGVVIIFASGPSIFTPILRLGGLKVITSLRAVDSERDKWGFISRKILRLGEYCAWRFSHIFTVNSLDMVNIYKPKRHDVVYIPNGAKAAVNGDDNILEDLGLKSGGYFLFAARFDPVKRLHKLLEAYALLSKPFKLPLVVAGGHSKDPKYEQEIRMLADDSVIFTGHISQHQLAPLMCHCRAFILPSILEGMSNSLLSAMASKRAVIAADIPANRDVIKGETDALFKADDTNELLTKMKKVSSDIEYCADIGERLSKVTHLHYSWERTAFQFYQIAKPFLNR